MHSLVSLAIWASTLLSAGIAAHAHPVPSSSIWSTTSPLVIRHNQTEDAFTHASFNLACQNCLNAPATHTVSENLDLSFDLAVLPGAEPCAANLSLNTVPLDLPESGNLASKPVQGSSSIKASGHDLTFDWTTTCVDDNSSHTTAPPAQVLTFKLTSVNGRSFDESSSAGFTLSFKDTNPPEFLRLASSYTPPVEIDQSWIDPPSSLRIEASTQSIEDSELQQHLQDLHYLEAEVDIIQDLIAEKKKLIADRLSQDLKSNIAQCKGLFCYFEVVYTHAHKSASTLYHKHKPNPFASSLDPQGFVLKGASKQSTMSVTQQSESAAATTALPAAPEQCHCKPENDTGGWPELPERPSTGKSSQRNGTSQPSSLQIVLESFFVFTGLALLFYFLRRCCGRRRQKAPRGIARERITINRGRKRGFWAWVSRRKAERAAERTSRTYRNIDEKRNLVDDQEKVLESHMQDEIQQLQIHEELRQLQNTRNEVDELIRAEEGRHMSAPPYSVNPFLSSAQSAAIRSNRSSHLSAYSIPHPINIPARHSYASQNHDHPQSLISPSSSAGMPFSPISRTTSLPSYRSKPPSYQGDGESSYAFSDSDEMTDGEGDHDAWTVSDDSSLPDLSPRPSGETLGTHFTGETARTFL